MNPKPSPMSKNKRFSKLFRVQKSNENARPKEYLANRPFQHKPFTVVPHFLFLPVYDIILDRYSGYVINKTAMPQLSKSDLFRLVKVPAWQGNKSKMERFWKTLLAIPFSPILLSLIVITKYNHNLNWLGYRFNYLFAKLFSLLKGQKLACYTREQRNSKHPDAVYEDIPAVLAYFKEKQLQVILYAFNPLSDSQQAKLDQLIADGLILDFCVINSLLDLKHYMEAKNIPLPISRLMLTDLSQRPDANDLGFTTEYDPFNEMNISLWSNENYGVRNENLTTQSTKSLFIRKHTYVHHAEDYTNDEILI